MYIWWVGNIDTNYQYSFDRVKNIIRIQGCLQSQKTSILHQLVQILVDQVIQPEPLES